MEVTPTSQFTDGDAELFEDGVDFVSDPEALGGQWRSDWSRELDQRVQRSDVIAVVTIHTVRTDIDPDQRSTYRLAAEVARPLLGEAPGDELALKVHEGESGFGTVEGNDRRILNQPFVAFVKWYQAEDETVAPHWHLAPASKPVMARVEYLVEKRRNVRTRGETPRTIVIQDDGRQ